LKEEKVPVDTEIRSQTLQFLSEISGQDPAALAASRDLLGEGMLDSLTIVNMIMFFEQNFGRLVDINDVIGKPLSIDRLLELAFQPA
jgi:acyl carrier protein